MSRVSVLDLRLRTRWRRGPAAASAGPLLVSYTEFTPRTMRDLPAIYRAAGRLRRELVELEGAVGVALYWQPLRRRVGSVSAWRDEESLRGFVALPYHRRIMSRYRDRGTLRATDWQADSLDLDAALRDGQSALDEGRGRRR